MCGTIAVPHQYPQLAVAEIERRAGDERFVAVILPASAAEQLGTSATRLARRPSEYVRDDVWFTTQPIEEPDDPEHLIYTIEQARLGDRLLFATDYPHWDFDSPQQALPRAMDAPLRRAILCETALALYGLPRERPA